MLLDHNIQRELIEELRKKVPAKLVIVPQGERKELTGREATAWALNQLKEKDEGNK